MHASAHGLVVEAPPQPYQLYTHRHTHTNLFFSFVVSQEKAKERLVFKYLADTTLIQKERTEILYLFPCFSREFEASTFSSSFSIPKLLSKWTTTYWKYIFCSSTYWAQDVLSFNGEAAFAEHEMCMCDLKKTNHCILLGTCELPDRR